MEEENHPLVTDVRDRKRLSCLKTSTVVLVLVVLLLASATVGLAIALGVSLSTGEESEPSGSNNCLTASCVKLAALVLDNMDATIDPCKDFYNFSCGNWDATHVLPTGYGRFSTFDELGTQNQIALKRILESSDDSDVEAVRKLKDLYKSCLDTDTIDDRGAAPLLTLIEDTGGWALIGMEGTPWSINSSDFRKELLRGSPAFLQLFVDVDDKNTSQYILQLGQSGLSLPSSSNYLDNRTAPENKEALKTFMTTVLSLLNSSVAEATYATAADDVIEFESGLAEIFINNVALRDPYSTYNKMTVGELSDLWPDFDWVGSIQALFDSFNISVASTEPIIVRTPDYFSNLTGVFQNASAETLENYAKWQLIRGFLDFLDQDFRAAVNAFQQAVSGSGGKERFQECINLAQGILPIALARPYTDFILPEGTKGNVSVMVDEVKTAFKERLETLTWLDKTTKERSKEKVDAITQMVAYPDQIHNDTYLNDLYKDLNISEGLLFENNVQYIMLSIQENYEQLRKPVDKTQWLNAPTAVNAYYSPQFNQFVFLEGILNTPFFRAGWPDYFKYGALGVVIGHELTHGFDDQGQQYNKDGNLEPWWTNQSVANFKERQKCFVEQYSKYSLFGFNVNGSLTLGENIADNGGVKASYQAYLNVAKEMKEPHLPAINYTPEQLYFIAFGQVWCSIFSPAYAQTSTKVDPHSPGPFRVIGALVNSPEFASAFKCPENSPMNPKDKCLMW